MKEYTIRDIEALTEVQAAQLADFWNECYKKNGTYFFEEVTPA